MSTKEVNDYLSELDESKRLTLERLRQSILDVVPDAQQGLSYGVPVFRPGGKAIAGYAAAKITSATFPTAGTC